MCVNNGVYAVLLGSGISRSAGIPTGWEVVLDLLRQLAHLEGDDCGEHPDAWFRTKHSSEPEYSAILEALAKAPAERRKLLQAYFEPTGEDREQGRKTPTAAHRAIARLVQSGHVRVILTTNFDRLMEKALAEVGITAAVISNGDQTEGMVPLVHHHCAILKLHGDYLDDRIMNTGTELGSYDPRMAAKLDQVLDEFGLIVSGWSGEWDQALRSAFERCPSRRYTTYWTVIGNSTPRAASLIAHRQAQVVQTAGADALFADLEEKVRSLEELRATPPSSVAVAVATLKRYLVEDRHRIRLDDMVREEAVEVAAATDELIPRSQLPDPANVVTAVRRIDERTGIVRAMFFHGCRHADGNKEDTFERALALMLPRAPWLNQSIYTAWSEMRFYPMGSVIYAGAYGALLGRNWSLLRKLLMMRFRSDAAYGRSGAYDMSAISTLEEFVAKSLKPNTKTAASDHVLDLLRPLVAGIAPDPESLFDELEVWIGLAAADAHVRLDRQRSFVPPGRFMWRGSQRAGPGQPAATFEQAEQAGSEWAPLQAGWFGGAAADFQNAKAHFVKEAERMRQFFW